MKILKVLLLVVAVLFVLVGSVVVYVGYRAQRAQHLVADFCASVSVGQASRGLAARARSSGLDVSELPERPSEDGAPPGSTLLCTQGVLLARHVCEIKISAGNVVKVDRGFID
jgi:hypothetical protein